MKTQVYTMPLRTHLRNLCDAAMSHPENHKAHLEAIKRFNEIVRLDIRFEVDENNKVIRVWSEDLTDKDCDRHYAKLNAD